MKTTVVMNPVAGSAGPRGSELQELARELGWTVCETRQEGDATRLARQAADTGSERVIAAGGDGTVSQVVRGLMLSDADSRPSLGVVPLGTGNDFARTLQMPNDVQECCTWLARAHASSGRMDLLEVLADGQTRWALNSVNGGIANEIRRNMDQKQKQRWGPLAFVLPGLEMAGDQVPHWDVSFQLDDQPAQRIEQLVCLVVANARSVGGGFQVAPSADIEDGRFDLVTISSQKVLELLDVAVRAKFGWTFGSDQVEHAQGRRVRVVAPPGFAYTVDGEELQAHEIEVSLLRGALPFVAGPGYAKASPSDSI